MRPHQISGAEFLLNRLLGKTDSYGSDGIEYLGASSSSSDNAENERCSMHERNITGAILADDVGTGKTLTCLSVLWAFIRHGRAKGMVVCPSSLVQHWAKEIKRWLPSSLANTALFVYSSVNNSRGCANTVIGHFIRNPAEVHPLLVLSYESYRNFSDALNRIESLQILVCDEGHRLKNAYGTKTSTALGNCSAIRRLVLTGTPIQNNLDELYSVVHFAVPWYLGNLQEFKAAYIDPITRSSRKDLSDTAMFKLRGRLQKILIRRTRDSIMRSILPPRRELVVWVNLSQRQRELYLEVTNGLEQQLTDSFSLKYVLPDLLRLRMICTIATNSSEMHSSGNLCTTEHDIFERSTKFEAVTRLLQEIKNAKPLEKVVVASNFVENLDICKIIAEYHDWPSLRLDGSVPSDRRQRIVDIFNDPKSPFFILFLSTKAGGVGLNLTGANRMVLLEPDWNPATDIQAMGRIWREGQTRPVYIYRLVAVNTIEESILKGQSEKNELNSVVHGIAHQAEPVTREGESDEETVTSIISNYGSDTASKFSVTKLKEMLVRLPCVHRKDVRGVYSIASLDHCVLIDQGILTDGMNGDKINTFTPRGVGYMSSGVREEQQQDLNGQICKQVDTMDVGPSVEEVEENELLLRVFMCLLKQ